MHRMPIHEDIDMVEDGEPYEVRRSIKERLFSRPWSPLKKTRTIIPKVPSKTVLVINNMIIAHPETAKRLREHMRPKIRYHADLMPYINGLGFNLNGHMT